VSILELEGGRLLPGAAGLSDEQVRALDLERHVIVSAGAGSGKTRTLTRRVLRILGSFAWEAACGEAAPGPEAMLVVTFTDRAAGEMRERIRRELGETLRELRDREAELVALPEVGPRHAALVDHLARSHRRFDRARIGTFHGFCAGALRELAASAGLDPGFRILEGAEGAAVRREAAEAAVREAEQAPDAGGRPAFRLLRRRGVLRALDLRLARPFEWGAAAAALAGETEEVVARWAARYGGGDLDALENDVAPGGALRSVLETVLGYRSGLQHGSPPPPVLVEIDAAIAAFDAAGADPRTPLDLGSRADRVRAFLDPLIVGEGRRRTWRKAHHTWLGPLATWRKLHRKGVRAAWVAARDLLVERLGAHAEVLDALPGRVDASAVAVLGDLTALGARAEALHRDRKASLHALDFDDLQLRLLELVESDPAARRRLCGRFRHILVDELQDTNEVQWRLIRALARLDPEGDGDPATLFLVGDRKQAVYRFRGGDVTLFDRVVDTLEPRGAAVVEFRRNFRSRPGLIAGFNRLHAWLMAPAGDVREPFEAPFAPLRAARALHAEERWSDDEGRIEILTALDAVDEREADAEEEGVAELVGPEREAAVVAERVRDLLDDAPRHGGNAVALLLRRRRNMALYARALRRAGVPHVVAGGRGFFGRQEVLDVADVLSGLLHSGDVVALVGALRGPLFGLEDAWLVRLALWGRERAGGSLREGWSAARAAAEVAHLDEAWPVDLPPEGRREIARAATRWLRWSRLVRAVSLSAFLRRMLEDAAAAHLFALGDPTGQTRANVEKLVRLAARFDAQGARGAAEFAGYLRRQEEADTTEGEAVVDASAPVVLMTIHQSKGLEFPVVVLPDLNARVRPGGHGEDAVLGRIRDVDGAERRELGAALPVVEARVRRRRKSLTARRVDDRERAEGIAEGKRLLYVAMTRARDRLICTTRPPSEAAEEPRPIDEAVAWEEWLRRWRVEDPAAEREVAVTWADARPAGPRRGVAPAPSRPADLVELAGVKRRLAPVRAPVIARLSPHALAEQEADDLADRLEPETAGASDDAADPEEAARRETAGALGRIRGLLVHACLEDGITEPSPVTSARIHRALAEAGLLEPDHVRRLEAALERHLAGYRRAAPAPLWDGGTVFVEQAFRLPLPVVPDGADGADLEGVIDVLYLDPERDCWVVLDYKSDAATDAELVAKYTPQLLAYAWAVARILPDVRGGARRVAAELLATGRGAVVEVLPPLDAPALETRFGARLRTLRETENRAGD